MRTDGQTDMTMLIVAFRNFAKEFKTPKWPYYPPNQLLFSFGTGFFLGNRLSGI